VDRPVNASQNTGLDSARNFPESRTDTTVVITPSVMKTSEPCSLLDPGLNPGFRRRPLTVTEWSRDSERWIVSARLGDSWTLIGVFEHADRAFQAADRAAKSLAPPQDR
jgi:hypothetical protein